MSNGRTWTDIQPALRPGMATLIFTNNIQVSFLAFAGGVLCGLGTAYVLVSNGLLLGGVLGAAQFYGVAPLVWSFISPHGYLELTCIVTAGAAALRPPPPVAAPLVPRCALLPAAPPRLARTFRLPRLSVHMCSGQGHPAFLEHLIGEEESRAARPHAGGGGGKECEASLRAEQR